MTSEGHSSLPCPPPPHPNIQLLGSQAGPSYPALHTPDLLRAAELAQGQSRGLRAWGLERETGIRSSRMQDATPLEQVLF